MNYCFNIEFFFEKKSFQLLLVDFFLMVHLNSEVLALECVFQVSTGFCSTRESFAQTTLFDEGFLLTQLTIQALFFCVWTDFIALFISNRISGKVLSFRETLEQAVEYALTSHFHSHSFICQGRCKFNCMSLIEFTMGKKVDFHLIGFIYL